MKLKCLIVDDEPLALDVLESYILKVPELEISGKCSNALEALEAVRKGDISLVFLDIQMPEVTGLEFLKSLKNPPAVIFTTAYADYAVEGFEMDAIDYLLKPISFERFLKAINKAIHHFKAESNTDSPKDSDHIFVKSDRKLIKLRMDDIFYIEGLKDYIMIYTHDLRIITLQTMKNMEERLSPDKFIRVHRSYIISLDKFKSVIGNSVEIKDKLIPIGKHYKEAFMKVIEKDSFIR